LSRAWFILTWVETGNFFLVFFWFFYRKRTQPTDNQLPGNNWIIEQVPTMPSSPITKLQSQCG
jgi:hypothetical protein